MTSLRLKRGITTQINSYTGPPGELTVDTTSNQLRLHNGTTAGGSIISGLNVTQVKTSAYNANVNELVRIDSTTGGFTIILPATPPDGARISFLDITNQCGTNPVLVAANGKTILGDSTGISLDANGAVLGLVFNNLTNNWSKTNMFSSSSFAVVDPTQNVTYVDDVFSTYTYTGNGSTQAINNGINLSGSGGMVWTKQRDGTQNHSLFDTIRGINNRIGSDATDANASAANTLTSFNNNGFSLGSNTTLVNQNTSSYVSWAFRKAAKFFDVVTWTGNGSTQTINHNLGVAPGIVIVKRTDNTGNWYVFHRSVDLDSLGNLFLDLPNAPNGSGAVDRFGNNSTTVTPSSSSFTVGSNSGFNSLNGTYVAYLFAHDTSTNGMIQCGTYNDSSNYSVNLGWEPQLLMIKNISTSADWVILDNMRGWPVDSNAARLKPNTYEAESMTNLGKPNATGFSGLAGSGYTYIYMAIRRPNKPPTLGTQVFNVIARTGTGAAATVTGVGFAPDLGIVKAKTNTAANIARSPVWTTRMSGNSRNLSSNTTNEESAWINYVFAQDGYSTSMSDGEINESTIPYINWFFKRAPGVVDIVYYTGTGVTRTVVHSLNTTPEMMIVKSRSGPRSWVVYHQSKGANWFGLLEDPISGSGATSIWNDTSPTTSVFTVGTGGTNVNAESYVAYLFSTKAGISKVGSYTGNGTNQTINCGFTTGARFILIKRTDSTGDWYVWDTTRGIIAGNDPHLSLNSSSAEVTSDDSIDPDNSGFIVNQVASTNINVNAGAYIFLAFA